jgi:soluble lytic murein transglycosylase-like protein
MPELGPVRPHRLWRIWLFISLALLASSVFAGAQQNETISASLRSLLQKEISDQASSLEAFASKEEQSQWLNQLIRPLSALMKQAQTREEFLLAVHYEAKRAGLDPLMVIGLIEVESGFRKYAISSAGARGFMQVMPFWMAKIGDSKANLFHLRTNLRFGCTILRYYLKQENNDLFRALGRYNGSLGAAAYPNMVVGAWKRWQRIAGTASQPTPPHPISH